jgi:hypothetical protein
MTKLKTWLDLALSPDVDWPPHQPVMLKELVAEARAIDGCALAIGASQPEMSAKLLLVSTGRVPERRRGPNKTQSVVIGLLEFEGQIPLRRLHRLWQYP